MTQGMGADPFLTNGRTGLGGHDDIFPYNTFHTIPAGTYGDGSSETTPYPSSCPVPLTIRSTPPETVATKGNPSFLSPLAANMNIGIWFPGQGNILKVQADQRRDPETGPTDQSMWTDQELTAELKIRPAQGRPPSVSGCVSREWPILSGTSTPRRVPDGQCRHTIP